MRFPIFLAGAAVLALSACSKTVHTADMGQPYQSGPVTEAAAPDTRAMGGPAQVAVPAHAASASQ